MNNLEFQTIKTTVDEDGIMTVWIDVPGKSVNTIGQKMLTELTEAVSLIEREKPKGVIFASKKHENFVAGGDLFEIRALKPDTMTQFLSAGIIRIGEEESGGAVGYLAGVADGDGSVLAI